MQEAYGYAPRPYSLHNWLPHKKNTGEARSHMLFREKADFYDSLCWRHLTMTAMSSIILVYSSHLPIFCQVQGITYGNIWIT